ncbi:conserved hypothetical protein [Uncinocarpus reesii 1704]|uniref:Uncharacterized protein n=1 Tax=Uncinocarpus reesii (strain UAMH 1704) TaxID=336963 RepID=C4JZI3_UNCRE|nr:uncharacterized protein UREG_07584 [Uncinocarpus reesii 1704]EEP82719.1 conserved hypothetical protein [Uncinocarpus reesii 1704]
MVYDWEGKRDVCYKMYIEEKRALEDIMEYMRTTHQFAPSKRAFQTQFKRWGFPSKQNPAHKNPHLVARVKQLWETNTMQRDMLRILNEEGYPIKERELMRLRAKNRWLLRVPNGMKSYRENGPVSTATTTEEDGSAEGIPLDEGQQTVGSDVRYLADVAASAAATATPVGEPEEMLKRQERLSRLQAESDERWATKKRRRRTRGWAGLPADPPGPPRFPSETTLDESKKILSLDDTMYRQLRDRFHRICEEAGFIKKTIAGPERWQEAKDRLIRESQHLRSVFWGESLETKALALDVICTDVTKRMRTLESRMTIAEAKNALGINPEESRQIRNTFYDTLKADHFTSKLEMGDERWSELKQQWIQGSELLQRILSPGAADPQHAQKARAVEVLCRDVMKRLRDDQAKRDPSKRQFTQNRTARLPQSRASTAFANGVSTLASQALASSRIANGELNGIQIDPSLIQAVTNTTATSSSADPSFSLAHPQPDAQQSFGYSNPILAASSMIPVFLRIHPQSQIHQDAKTWISKLNSRSVDELRMLALMKFKDARVARIEGTVKDEDGRDIPFLITEDHELDAYLTHVQGRTATFLFCLQPAQ